MAAAILVLQVLYLTFLKLWSLFAKSNESSEDARLEEPAHDIANHANRSPLERLKKHIRDYGGSQIFAYSVARWLGSIALLYLSGKTVGGCYAGPVSDQKDWKKVILNCPEIAMFMTYVRILLASRVSAY